MVGAIYSAYLEVTITKELPAKAAFTSAKKMCYKSHDILNYFYCNEFADNIYLKQTLCFWFAS